MKGKPETQKEGEMRGEPEGGPQGEREQRLRGPDRAHSDPTGRGTLGGRTAGLLAHAPHKEKAYHTTPEVLFWKRL